MRRWQRLACPISVIAVVGALVAFPTPARALGTTYVVGVDNASPSGHNYQYNDFFPNSSLAVTTGDIVDFKWNAGSLDGLHTATVLAGNPTWGPPNISDGDDSATQQMLDPAVFAPQFPPGGPCGAANHVCGYDGTQDISSGAMPTALGGHFFVQINVAAPRTVNFICRIHPGHKGTLSVVPAGQGSAQSAVLNAANTQYVNQTANALAAEAVANTEAVSTNPNGTHTVTMKAGTGIPGVEILENLPTSVHIAAGDTVKWVTSSGEIHTVTFPNGHGSDSVDPIPVVCEGIGTADPPAPGGPPPNNGCSSASETHFNVQPQGPTTISSPSTVASSGIIANNPQAPFPSNYSFTFPNAGAYTYICRIHDHMTGTVFAANAPSYQMVASDGGQFPFGKAGGFGSLGDVKLNKPVVNIAATPDGGGYWMVASDGGVFPFGNAGGFGSTGNVKLNQPMVGMAATPDAGGYWLVASDGGIFPFGNAGGFGSTGNVRLNKPIVSMAATPTGLGYWLVASDGGVFPFGDAGGFGSLGNVKLNKPVVGMASTPSGRGYWLVASDGGVFPFGDAAGLGSTGNIALNQPIVALAPTVHGDGYWLIAADGGVFPFGNASGLGSLGNVTLNKPIVGATGV